MVNKDISRGYLRHRKTAFARWRKRYFGSSIGNIIFNILLYLFLIGVAFLTFYPFYHVVKVSLTANRVVDGVPKSVFSFSAYLAVLDPNAQFNIIRPFIFSVIIVVIATVLQVFLTMLTAYPLSNAHLKGRTFFLLYIIFTMLFSGGLIPFYLLIRSLGLMGNPAVYVVIGLLGGFNIIISKNFMQGIPESLRESARIDGAGEYRILFMIYLPLCMPIMATIALWVGVGKWNDWMTGVLYIKKMDWYMIQNFLRYILASASSDNAPGGIVDPNIRNMAEGVKMATIVIGTIPIIMVYPFVQKYFVKGVILGSVKG